jgi:predicted secreted acid phosphatase
MPAVRRRLLVAVLSLSAALSAGVAAAPAGAATAPAAALPRAAATAVTYESWLADVRPIAAEARAYLETRIPQSPAARQAIVLDIDNTSLASHFSSAYPVPATPPVLDLARYAARRGVRIFFVTGRPDLIDAVTLHNLRATGYSVAGLHSRNLIELLQPLDVFKTAARTEIEAAGYTIIANVGNNTTDLSGGHAERTFKLPDYDGLLD